MIEGNKDFVVIMPLSPAGRDIISNIGYVWQILEDNGLTLKVKAINDYQYKYVQTVNIISDPDFKVIEIKNRMAENQIFKLKQPKGRA